MHVKELKRANGLLQQLETLDKEIIQIGKYAQLIKDKHLCIQLELSHVIEKAEPVRFDEDASLMFSRTMFPNMHNFIVDMNPLTYGHRREQPIEPKDNCKMPVSEIIALQVLGVMVAHKEAERMHIINQLNQMGFQVNI